MKSLVSAVVQRTSLRTSHRVLVRLLGLAPAALLLSGLFTVWAGPLAAPVVAASLAPGTVVAWGDNNDGETDVPAGLSGVVAIAAGDDYSLALKSDGTVVAWGPDWLGATLWVSTKSAES